jgi:hypothetical protein
LGPGVDHVTNIKNVTLKKVDSTFLRRMDYLFPTVDGATARNTKPGILRRKS